MKQFNVVFGVLTVFYFVCTLIIDIAGIVTYKNADNKNVIDTFRKNFNTNMSDDSVILTIEIGVITLMVSCTIFFILLVRHFFLFFYLFYFLIHIFNKIY